MFVQVAHQHVTDATDAAGQVRLIQYVDHGASGIGELNMVVLAPHCDDAPETIGSDVLDDVLMIQEVLPGRANALRGFQHGGTEDLFGQSPMTGSGPAREVTGAPDQIGDEDGIF